MMCTLIFAEMFPGFFLKLKTPNYLKKNSLIEVNAIPLLYELPQVAAGVN